jgi:hypothetical protein
MIGSMGMVGAEQVAEPGAQRRPALRAEGHEWIERAGGTGLPGSAGSEANRPAWQQPRRSRIWSPMATPTAGCAALWKTPKGRFWIGNAPPGTIGRGYPALPLRIMCSIHGCIYRNGAPGEVLFERLPHLEVIALQAIRLQREAGRVKHQLGLEHEGQGVRRDSGA